MLTVAVLTILTVIALIDRRKFSAMPPFAEDLSILIFTSMILWMLKSLPLRPDYSFMTERARQLPKSYTVSWNICVAAVYWCWLTSFVGVMSTIIFFLVDCNLSAELSVVGSVLHKIVGLVGLIPFICLSIRRLHDMNRTAAFAYVLAITGGLLSIMLGNDVFVVEPISFDSALLEIHGLIFLYLLLRRGTRGANDYGPAPFDM